MKEQLSLEDKQFLKTYDASKFLRPNVTVDMVIYTIKEGQLHALLIKRSSAPFKEQWSLVGGFIDIEQDQDLETTALRKLKEKTGIVSPYLEQFATVGNATRDPRGWSVSAVYFALLPYEKLSQSLLENQNILKLSPIRQGNISEILAFDHNEILNACTERLQSKVMYTSLPLYLLKPPFTLREVRETYEIVLDTTIEPKSFRRRISGAGILKETGKTVQTQSKRPAMLYTFKTKKPYYFRVLMME